MRLWKTNPLRLGGIIVALALSLGLAGCSALKLGYATMPELLYWWLDGYADFNDDQEPLVRGELARLHEWHRREELPRIADALGRLEQLAPGDARRLTMGTFHAVCARILRRDGPQIGVGSNFTIYDDGDQINLVKTALKELNLDERQHPPRAILARISNAKSDLKGPTHFAEQTASYWEEIVLRVYRRYQRKLFASNAVDFDDILMLTVDVLERFPEARTTPWGDAETREQLAERVVAALSLIADRHPDGRVLAVTHGGPIRAVLRRCSADVDGPIVNCHVARIAVVSGALTPID